MASWLAPGKGACNYFQFPFLKAFQGQSQHNKKNYFTPTKRSLGFKSQCLLIKLYWDTAADYSCFCAVKAKLSTCDRHHKTAKTPDRAYRVCVEEVHFPWVAWLCLLSQNLHHEMSTTDTSIFNSSTIFCLLYGWPIPQKFSAGSLQLP